LDAPTTPIADNPLLDDWGTPFDIPPFDRIHDEHFGTALDAAFTRQRMEVEAIIANPAPPTFENTIEALERARTRKNKVLKVFGNITATDTNDALDALEIRIKPLDAKERDRIYLDESLYSRVKAVYDARESLELHQEEMRLLELTHRDFVHAGAAVPKERRGRLQEINARLAELTARFGQNLRAETKGFALVITDEADLSGLPADVITAGRATAEARGKSGAWAFGLDRSAFEAFMKFADNRDLRRQMLEAYRDRGSQGNEADNRAILMETARLRAERAALLGFDNHAAYQLRYRMARSPEIAERFLLEVWEPGLARAREELADMEKLAVEDGVESFEGWDWWYYAEKVRAARYDIDLEATKPYFELSRVREGAFYVASRLFRIRFEPLDDVPVWHPDVRAWKVLDADGTHLGVFMTDDYARDSKSGGAWMNTYRNASRLDGDVRPVVTNNLNLIKPPPGQPTLMSFDEAETLFHEFGHALQGLLTQVRYERFSGTSGLPRDYVELCSQILEHWASEPEVLAVYARHYETDEIIPQGLIDKISASSSFNQGFMTTEYIAASLLDLAWHTLSAEEAADVTDPLSFEREVLDSHGLLPEIGPRYRSPYFSHIFAGGYSAGYYAYLWSEILDADGFTAFKERGDIFDPLLARRFRVYILEAGGREEPEILYRKFRGKDPDILPLLTIRGLINDG
jgi:peptidyl-dipeptidase Dcp